MHHGDGEGAAALQADVDMISCKGQDHELHSPCSSCLMSEKGACLLLEPTHCGLNKADKGHISTLACAGAGIQYAMQLVKQTESARIQRSSKVWESLKAELDRAVMSRCMW